MRYNFAKSIVSDTVEQTGTITLEKSYRGEKLTARMDVEMSSPSLDI